LRLEKFVKLISDAHLLLSQTTQWVAAEVANAVAAVEDEVEVVAATRAEEAVAAVTKATQTTVNPLTK